MVTASHNPLDYNGMKLVREGSRPISGDTGLDAIRALAETGDFPAAARQGQGRAPATFALPMSSICWATSTRRPASR